MNVQVFFVCSTGLGHDTLLLKCGAWQSIECNGQDYGFVLGDPSVRTLVDDHHNEIFALPGVRGTLTAEQAAFMIPSYPSAVEGTRMYDVMLAVYTTTGFEPFNPDNY